MLKYSIWRAQIQFPLPGPSIGGLPDRMSSPAAMPSSFYTNHSTPAKFDGMATSVNHPEKVSLRPRDSQVY
jgi:hypothetical protein